MMYNKYDSTPYMVIKMNKIDIIDFSDWNIYDGFSEGSGRSEKQWLQAPDGTIGLFKWPKINSDNVHTSYEHISEHLAYQLGLLLDIPTARIDIGYYKRRIGSLSYRINKPNEELCEGLSFILEKHPDYDPDKLYDSDTQKYYSIEHIIENSETPEIADHMVGMMFFDYLIGNSDRHQNNWAFLRVTDPEARHSRRLCPLYDNGSSLCCYVDDNETVRLLGNDRMRIEALVNTKSRSLIRIDPMSKKLPLHSEVVRYLLRNFDHSAEIVDKITAYVTKSAVDDILCAYPDEVLPYQRKRLIALFLAEKVDLLGKIRGAI